MKRRLTAPIATAILVGLMVAGPATATHSLPQPFLWYWDVGNNGTPDAAVGVDAQGSGWTTLALTRLQGAINEFSGDTQFAPFYVSTGPNDVYRDGTAPSGGFSPNDWAVTLVYFTYRPFPGQPGEYYYDIGEVDTFFQSDVNLPGGAVRYWYGASHSGLSTDVDFQGIWTHELGHWVLLDDLYGSNCNYGSGMYTMCGETTSNYDDESWWMRSLTSDDIAATNVVY